MKVRLNKDDFYDALVLWYRSKVKDTNAGYDNEGSKRYEVFLDGTSDFDADDILSETIIEIEELQAD